MVLDAIKAICIVAIISIGLTFISRTLIEDAKPHIPTTRVSERVETTAMDKLMAEDLSLTTSMFIKQLSAQLHRWQKTDRSNEKLRIQFEREIKEHPHFNGFAIIENGQAVETVGDITEIDPTKLTHRHMKSEFSAPYTVNKKQYMLLGEKMANGKTIIGEIDLSFVQSFVKNIASVADSTGTFFVTGDDPKVDWKTTEDLPEHIHTEIVPELGWQIAVHSKDEEEKKPLFHEKQAVIKLKKGAQIDKWIEENDDLTMIERHPPFFIVQSNTETTEQLIKRLKRNYDIALAEPNYIISKQKTKATKRKKKIKVNEVPRTEPNDEFFKPYQWNLDQIKVSKGWSVASGQDVTIAILDTGVDPGHHDLKDKLLPGYNTFNNSGDYTDEHGHGTHVAGVAAALTNNVTGIAGVSWKSNILPVKVLNEEGEGSSYEVAKGIYWAVDNGADVINMSLGDYHNSQMLYEAIRYAYEQDVILISASGNDNVDEPMYPSQYKEVFSVAAVDEARNRAFFSNYGPHVDISAPGEHIPSLFPNNNYVVMSGTSMAAPHVSGLAALIRSLRPDLSNKQVYEVIAETANDLGPKGHDIYYGHGEINVEKALQTIKSKK